MGPEATPYEKLRAHVYATNSGPITNMILYDHFLRSVAVAGAAVTGAIVTVEVAPVRYEAGETAICRSSPFHPATVHAGESKRAALAGAALLLSQKKDARKLTKLDGAGVAVHGDGSHVVAGAGAVV